MSSSSSSSSSSSATAAAPTESKAPEVEGLDMDLGDSDDQIVFVSKNGDKMGVTRKWAMVSNLVKETVKGDETAEEVPIPGVETPVLAKVIEYMTLLEGMPGKIIEKPLRSNVMADLVPKKIATFIDGVGDSNRQDLYDLILAANYMDIKCLLHLGCGKVASLIKGKPLEKIKGILSKGTKSEAKGDSKTKGDSK